MNSFKIIKQFNNLKKSRTDNFKESRKTPKTKPPKKLSSPKESLLSASANLQKKNYWNHEKKIFQRV